MAAPGTNDERRARNFDESSCSFVVFKGGLAAAKPGQRSQLGTGKISKLFQSISTSRLGLNLSGHSTRSLCTTDLPLPEVLEDDNVSMSSSFHDDQTSHGIANLKICGIQWKSSKQTGKYAQLQIVPQDTVVLVRRAPQRQRCVRRVTHSGISSAGMQSDTVLQAKSPAKYCADIRAVSSMQPLSLKHRVRPVAASA